MLLTILLHVVAFVGVVIAPVAVFVLLYMLISWFSAAFDRL